MAHLTDEDYVRGVNRHEMLYRTLSAPDGRTLGWYASIQLPHQGPEGRGPEAGNRFDIFRRLAQLGILFMPEVPAAEFDGSPDTDHAAVFYDQATSRSDIEHVVSLVRERAAARRLATSAIGESEGVVQRAEPGEMASIVDLVLAEVQYPVPG